MDTSADTCRGSRGFKCLVFFVVFFLFTTVFQTMWIPFSYADVVVIPDAALRAGLNGYLAEEGGVFREVNADISEAELLGIKELSLDEKGIEDIRGLEHCAGLERLSLNDNRIKDLSSLEGLRGLEHLSLIGNSITDFSPLGRIVNEKYLRVYGTGQVCEGVPIVNTSSAISFQSPLRYKAGAMFNVWDFIPQGKSGRYIQNSNTLYYDNMGISSSNEVSYMFNLNVTEAGAVGRDVNMSGRISHEVIVPKCKVIFDKAGGEVTSGASEVEVVLDNALVSFPQVSKRGHTFLRWENESGGTADLGYAVHGPQTLTAVWGVNDYRVFYDAGEYAEWGDDGSLAHEKVVTFGRPIGELAIPARRGYNITGWLNEEGEEVTEETVHSVPDDVTVYARWAANVYTVTFDANGGTFQASGGESGGAVGGASGGASSGAAAAAAVSTATKAAVYDGIYGVFPRPEQEGLAKDTRRFEGWWTEADGGIRVLETDEVDILNDITLYAHWSHVDKVSITPAGEEAWKTIDGYQYRFDKEGNAFTGLKKIDGYYYYFDTEGKMLKSGKVKASKYFLKANKVGHITNMPSPNKTSVKSAKVKGGGKVLVKWKRLIGVSGYQVQYALDKEFTKEIGRVDVKGRFTLRKTLKELANDRRYYVRVRGYFKIGGLDIPGKYSKKVRAKR